MNKHRRKDNQKNKQIIVCQKDNQQPVFIVISIIIRHEENKNKCSLASYWTKFWERIYPFKPFSINKCQSVVIIQYAWWLIHSHSIEITNIPKRDNLKYSGCHPCVSSFEEPIHEQLKESVLTRTIINGRPREKEHGLMICKLNQDPFKPNKCGDLLLGINSKSPISWANYPRCASAR